MRRAMPLVSALPFLPLLSLLALAPPLHADVEKDLIAHFKGSYVVTMIPVFSECTAHYTDDEVTASRASRGKGQRFAPGEIVRVDKVDVTFTRIDVNIGFSEPILQSWTDGPYTVYEQRFCKVSLNLALASDVRRDTAKATEAIEALLQSFPTIEAARKSKAWNGRKVEPYPKNWEKTKAEYAVWKAKQVNTAVQAKLDEAIEEAGRAMDRIYDSPDALASFAAGVRFRRDDSFDSCDEMIRDSFYARGGGGSNVKDSGAFDEGQRLGHYLALARKIRKCFLPTPAG